MRLDYETKRGDEWPNLSDLGEPGKERPLPLRARRSFWGYVQIAIEVVLLVIAVMYLRNLLTK